MRIAWFSPLPPVPSGIAASNATLLMRLDEECAIDRFVDAAAGAPHPSQPRTFDAHDFVWKQQRVPYDLVAYQLGNAPCHDYIWAYLARYPGLVVLHDPRLHQARARQLLSRGRHDDYRHEFWYDHPDARRDFVEYAVEGLGGPIYHFWSMLRVVMRTARLVAVHNPRVAADLRDAFPNAPIAAIHLGKPALAGDAGGRGRVRASLGASDATVVFAVFGKITADKRIGPILRAFASLDRDAADALLLLVGDPSDYPHLGEELAREGLADRVRVTGHVPDAAVADHLAAADACLCLRWPTALETSAAWIDCLAAGRATVITALAHLVDIPTVDPRDWRPSSSDDPVAIAIDLLDEERSLALALRRLSGDAPFRRAVARAGHAYWAREHTLDLMVDDYRRILAEAARRDAPRPDDLPVHFTDDGSGLARRIAGEFGIELDILT